MKRNILPTITEPSTTVTEAKVNVSNQFSNLLRKYKKKRKNEEDKNTISHLKIDTNAIIQMEEEDKKSEIDNQKFLIKILDSHYSNTFEKLKKEYTADKNDSIIIPKKKKGKYGFEQFSKTSYVNENCMKEFYNKYQKFRVINRKSPIQKYTPSFAFIQSSNEEKIVPNPLGLVRRKGNDKALRMTYQKVGDSYSKVLSNSLKYKENLNSIELASNRLTHYGTSYIFKSINDNQGLISTIRNLDLSDNKIGRNDITNIIKYIEDEKCNLENFNIFGNLLGDENIKKLGEALAQFASYRMQLINFGKNNISDICCPILVDMIKSCTGLRIFNLSHNKLTNKGGTLIMKQLRTHTELRVLDLAWNNIGDYLTKPNKFETIVNQFYRNNDREQRVFNNFHIDEAIRTARVNFRRNPFLPSIDSKAPQKKPDKKAKDQKVDKPIFTEPKKVNEPIEKPSNFANELGGYFKEKSLTLVHLDISHNNLSTIDCEFLSKEVKDNHTILGIHVDGNEMQIDPLGFLKPINNESIEETYYANSQLSYDISKTYEMRKTHIDNVRKLRSLNNCWICDGYREVKFIYQPKEPILDQQNHIVKIHLDFEDYKPFDMMCIGSKFQIVRMCPPGEINYFFSLDTIPVEEEGSSGENEIIPLSHENQFQVTFDSEYMEELNNIRAKLSFEKRQAREKRQKEIEEMEENGEEVDPKLLEEEKDEKEGVIYDEPNNNKITVTVKAISKKSIKVNMNVVDEDYHKNIKYSEPRPLKLINKFVKPRTPWTYPISIWAYYDYEYEGEPEEYLDQMFEFDFKRCQFFKDFKDDEQYEELRQMLRERYRDIIDCYKYYSSLGGFNVWQISQNVLTEFISKCPGMCDKTYDINNVFLTQKVVLANANDLNDRKKNNNKMLNENNIVRHQFMNLLVKTAKDKYVTCLKTTTDVLEATKISFSQHYDVAIVGFEYHKWRKERYYNEPVDNFLKAHLPLIDGIYKSWAKQKGPRKVDVWMTCDEFNTFVQSFVDINEYPVRDIPLIFNYSIKLQINEIYTDKHLNMFLPEFLEGMCRAIDKASPIPPNENPEEWSKEKRNAQPLINKIENIFPKLLKGITHPDFKVIREKFPMPEKDFATGLYNYNYDNPFYQGYIIKVNLQERANKRKGTRRNTRRATTRFENEIKNINKVDDEKKNDDDEEKKENKVEGDEDNKANEGEKINNDGGEVLEFKDNEEADEKKPDE